MSQTCRSRFRDREHSDRPGQTAEQWDSQGKGGELNILVNTRFLVTLDGNDIENAKVLHDLAGKIDLAKLAQLK